MGKSKVGPRYPGLPRICQLLQAIHRAILSSCITHYALLKKDVQHEENDKAEAAFQSLNKAFTSVPVLVYFNPANASLVECDISDFVISGILAQPVNGILHPVACWMQLPHPRPRTPCYRSFFRDLTPSPWWRLTPGWCPHGPQKSGTIHKTELLNRRQARWFKCLSEFDFLVRFRPVTKNGKPVALIRKSGHIPKEGNERLTHHIQTILKLRKLKISAVLNSRILLGHDTALEELIVSCLAFDKFANSVTQVLTRNHSRHHLVPLGKCQQNEKLFLVNVQIYVPDYDMWPLQIIQSCHDNHAACQTGRSKTYELVSQSHL